MRDSFSWRRSAFVASAARNMLIGVFVPSSYAENLVADRLQSEILSLPSDPSFENELGMTIITITLNYITMSTPTVSKIYNLIILDESGSMESIKQPTINGFNEILQSIRHSAKESPEITQFLSFISFNGSGIKEIFPLKQVDEIPVLTKENYMPDNNTPLYDAIGYGVNKLRYAIEKEKDYSVLVTILTDGEENSSKEYSFQTIAALIRNLRNKGWVFTYVGANHDVEHTAISLNISNSLTFEASGYGVQSMASKVDESRKNYMKKIRKGEKNLGADYFKEN